MSLLRITGQLRSESPDSGLAGDQDGSEENDNVRSPPIANAT